MEKKKIKKGDPCVITNRYNSSKSRNPRETKVLSAGRKWIYVESFGKSNKFDAETLCSDYGGYNIFIGNLEEYNEYVRLNKIKSRLVDEINSSIEKLSVGNLQKVKDLIESLTE